MSDWVWFAVWAVFVYLTCYCSLRGYRAFDRGTFEWWWLWTMLSFLGAMLSMAFLIME